MQLTPEFFFMRTIWKFSLYVATLYTATHIFIKVLYRRSGQTACSFLEESKNNELFFFLLLVLNLHCACLTVFPTARQLFVWSISAELLIIMIIGMFKRSKRVYRYCIKYSIFIFHYLHISVVDMYCVIIS